MGILVIIHFLAVGISVTQNSYSALTLEMGEYIIFCCTALILTGFHKIMKYNTEIKFYKKYTL